jgi:beta-mannosidase
MSEYGFQSYPLLETVKTFTHPEDRTLDSEVMQAHQRCMADDMKDKTYGNSLIIHYMDQYYHTPKDFESYLYVSQLLQKKGLAMAIEAHRRNMPFCMGTLYWQLNDCWPVASWSSVDYEGRWKAAHFKVKELYGNQMISVWKEKDSIEIHIANDATDEKKGTLQVTLMDLNGKVCKHFHVPVILKQNTSSIYLKQSIEELTTGKNKAELIFTASLRMNGEIPIEAIYYFVPEKMQPLKKPAIKQRVSAFNGQYKIEITSETLARDVYLSFPGDRGIFSKNFIDLIPGKKTEITYTPEPGNVLPDIKNLKIMSLYDSYENIKG